MTGYDFDPIASDAQFSGDSLLERVARAYEAAVDSFGEACDAAAIAENEYLRLFAVKWAEAVEDGVVAATIRAKHVDTDKAVCEAKQEFNRKAAAERRTKAKTVELQNRLTAVMSHTRFVREGS